MEQLYVFIFKLIRRMNDANEEIIINSEQNQAVLDLHEFKVTDLKQREEQNIPVNAMDLKTPTK